MCGRLYLVLVAQGGKCILHALDQHIVFAQFLLVYLDKFLLVAISRPPKPFQEKLNPFPALWVGPFLGRKRNGGEPNEASDEPTHFSDLHT